MLSKTLRFNYLYALLFVVVFRFNALSQTPLFEDLIENIAENSDIEIDYSSLYEDLNYYYNNPLNLNTATSEELERLKILSEFQIKSLHRYIERKGNMLSVYELQVIPGFSGKDIKKLLPFVCITPKPRNDEFRFKNAVKYGKHQLFLRTQKVIEPQVGYSFASDSILAAKPNSRYLGNPYKLYSQYKYRYKDRIFYGITAEKDAGEEFFEGNNPNGFDFYSAHFQLNKIGIIKTLTLGDFQAQFGQGLVLWSNIGFGKTCDVLNIAKKAQGLKKYSSTNENMFMRGIGTTIQLKKFNFTVFYSKKKIDANIKDSINNKIASVSSLQNTGYHSTYSEIEDKDAIDEKIIGGDISYKHPRFKVGITAVNYRLGCSLLREINPENQFQFRGNQNSNVGINYSFRVSDFIFFGEEAYSFNKGKAFLNGMLLNPISQVSLSAIHRSYGKKYQASYANAFSESSGNRNESGFYFGIRINPIKYWMINAYYDIYKFDWFKYNADAPSNGNEWLVEINYTPKQNLEMYFRIKNEKKYVNNNLNSGLNKLTKQSNLKLRYHVSYRVNKNLLLKNRIEISRFIKAKNTTYGYLVFQDVFYDFVRVPISLNMRYAIFDTDSYDTRIYTYESDILYSFSIPAYYSKGSRFYLNIKYNIARFMSIWLKWGQTFYSDKQVISSGLTQINGNTKSEIKLQIRFKL